MKPFRIRRIFLAFTWLFCFILSNRANAQFPYCVPTYSVGNTEWDIINTVNLNLYNGSISPQSPDYYLLNSDTIAALSTGSQYNLIVSTGFVDSNSIGAWLDWNADGDFADSGEALADLQSINLPAEFIDTISFTVPATASPGTRVLRIRTARTPNPLDPCLTYTYGETEDYYVNITTLPCEPGTVVPASSLVCSGQPNTFTLVGATSDSIIQWQYSPSNFVWVNGFNGDTNPWTLTSITSNQFVRACTQPPTCMTVCSEPIDVTVASTPVVIVVPDSINNEATVYWTPVAQNSYTVSWTGGAVGGPVVTGSPFTIPGLTPGAPLCVTVMPNITCLGVTSGLACIPAGCNPPTGLSVVPASDSALFASWDSIPGVSSYRVFYKKVTAAVYEYVDTAANHKTINGLDCNSTYNVYVTTLDCPSAGVVGLPSPVINGTVICASIDSLFNIPVNINLTNADTFVQVNISWSGDATGDTIITTDGNGNANTSLTLNLPDTAQLNFQFAFTDCYGNIQVTNLPWNTSMANGLSYTNDYCPPTQTVTVTGQLQNTNGALVTINYSVDGIQYTTTTDPTGFFFDTVPTLALQGDVFFSFDNCNGDLISAGPFFFSPNDLVVQFDTNYCPNTITQTVVVMGQFTNTLGDSIVVTVTTDVGVYTAFTAPNGLYSVTVQVAVLTPFIPVSFTDCNGASATYNALVNMGTLIAIANPDFCPTVNQPMLSVHLDNTNGIPVMIWITIDSLGDMITYTDAQGNFQMPVASGNVIDIGFTDCNNIGQGTTIVVAPTDSFVTYNDTFCAVPPLPVNVAIQLTNAANFSVPVTITTDLGITGATVLANGGVYTGTLAVGSVTNPVAFSFVDCYGVAHDTTIIPLNAAVVYTDNYCPGAVQASTVIGQLMNTNGQSVQIVFTQDTVLAVAFTDSTGWFNQTLYVSSTDPIVYASFTDCNGTPQTDTLDFTPLFAVYTADYCETIAPPDSCNAFYTVEYCTCDTFILKLDSLAEAQGGSYFWDFGDGSTSTEQFPTHTYAVDAVYNVCLTHITPWNDTCSYCHNIGIDSAGNVVLRMDNDGFVLNAMPYNANNVNEKPLPNETFDIFPNPVGDDVAIQLYSDTENDYAIQIHNAVGQLVETFAVHAQKGHNAITLPVQRLAAGVYLMTVRFDTKKTSRTFVK